VQTSVPLRTWRFYDLARTGTDVGEGVQEMKCTLLGTAAGTRDRREWSS